MARRLLGLIVFLLVANAGIHGGLAFFHDQEFRDAVRQVALFGAGKSDDALKQSVMNAAADNSIPLDDDFIDISRTSIVGSNDHVVIKYAYAEMIELLPKYSRRFDFSYTTP
ncbi:MAG TPA: hypothetical protein VGL62_16510 [Vicinamibacterales bacterium]|jgi:hypothetical protein